MPNKPKTPHRTIRIPSPEWEAAQTKARAEGVTVSHVVRAALRAYIAHCDHQWARRGSPGDAWRECSLCGRQEDIP